MRTREWQMTAVIGLSLMLFSIELDAQLIPTNGLVGYWKADNNTADSSGYNNSGSGSVLYSEGVVDEAFNLSTDYVSVPDAPQYGFTGDFSVGFWFKGTDQTDRGFIGQSNGGGGTEKWMIQYGYSGSTGFAFHVNGSGGSYYVAENSTNYQFYDGVWHQFTLTKQGTAISMFMDGASVSVNSGLGSVLSGFPASTAPLTIGATEIGRFEGSMDEIVLYNRALTSTEVAQLWAIPEPNFLVALLGLSAAFFATRNRSLFKRRVG